jgi:hypothetical protein
MAYSQVSETFWHDPTIRGLSGQARMFMLYLLTCPHRNRLGCFVLDPFYAAADLQWDVAPVRDALTELKDAGRIGWDEANRVVFVVHYLRHNTLQNQNVVKGAINDLSALPDTWLLEPLAKSLAESKEVGGRAHYTELLSTLGFRVARVAKSVVPQGQRNRSPNDCGNSSPANGLGIGSTSDALVIPDPYLTKPKPGNSETKGASPGVDKSVARLHAIAEEMLSAPPEQPRTNALTVSELEELAAERLGLKILPPGDLATNSRILKDWAYGSGRNLEEIEAAILGLADMVARHRPEVSDWLHPGIPITLKALQVNTLYDQGDGKAQRPLWDVAVEHYRASSSFAPAHTPRGTGPQRIKVAVDDAA